MTSQQANHDIVRNPKPALAALVQQREALEQQIAKMQSEGRSKAIVQLRTIMAEHGLTQADISLMAKTPVAAKYRDNQVIK